MATKLNKDDKQEKYRPMLLINIDTNTVICGGPLPLSLWATSLREERGRSDRKLLHGL